MQRGWGLAAIALMVAGCGLSSAPAPRRPSEAMERSARLLRQLDKLEADLHAGAEETTTYAVLVERHGEAQEMACHVTDDHVNEIHRLAEAQQKKVAEKRKKRTLAQLQRTGAPRKNQN